MPPPDVTPEERANARQQLRTVLLRVTKGDAARSESLAIQTEANIYKSSAVTSAAQWRGLVNSKLKALLAKAQASAGQQARPAAAAAAAQAASFVAEPPVQAQPPQQPAAAAAAPHASPAQSRPQQQGAAPPAPQAPPSAPQPGGAQLAGAPAPQQQQAAPAAAPQAPQTQQQIVAAFSSMHAWGRAHLVQDLKDLTLALEQSLRTTTNQESRAKMQPKLQRANQVLAMLKTEESALAPRMDERNCAAFRTALEHVSKDVKQFRRYREQQARGGAPGAAQPRQAGSTADRASPAPGPPSSSRGLPSQQQVSESSASGHQMWQMAAGQAATSRAVPQAAAQPRAPPGAAPAPVPSAVPADGPSQLLRLLKDSSPAQLAAAATAFGQARRAWQRASRREEDWLAAVPLPAAALQAAAAAGLPAAPPGAVGRRAISYCGYSARVAPPGGTAPGAGAAGGASAMEVDGGEETSAPCCALRDLAQAECDQAAAQLQGRATLEVVEAADSAGTALGGSAAGGVLVRCVAAAGSETAGAGRPEGDWRALLLWLPARYPQQPLVAVLPSLLPTQGAGGAARWPMAAATCREAFADACQVLAPPVTVARLAAAWADAAEAAARMQPAPV